MISKRRARIKPVEDATKYILSARDKPGVAARFINNVKGRGVFATEPIEQGSFVLEYRGEFMSAEECRSRKYSETQSTFLYEFDWQKHQWCIDASKEDGSLGRLVNDNHKSPNCIMKKVIVNNRPHLCLFAVRNIKVGTELDYNYGDSKWPWRQKQAPAPEVETAVLPLNISSQVHAAAANGDDELKSKHQVTNQQTPAPEVETAVLPLNISSQVHAADDDAAAANGDDGLKSKHQVTNQQAPAPEVETTVLPLNISSQVHAAAANGDDELKSKHQVTNQQTPAPEVETAVLPLNISSQVHAADDAAAANGDDGLKSKHQVTNQQAPAPEVETAVLPLNISSQVHAAAANGDDGLKSKHQVTNHQTPAPEVETAVLPLNISSQVHAADDAAAANGDDELKSKHQVTNQQAPAPEVETAVLPLNISSQVHAAAANGDDGLKEFAIRGSSLVDYSDSDGTDEDPLNDQPLALCCDEVVPKLRRTKSILMKTVPDFSDALYDSDSSTEGPSAQSKSEVALQRMHTLEDFCQDRSDSDESIVEETDCEETIKDNSSDQSDSEDPRLRRTKIIQMKKASDYSDSLCDSSDDSAEDPSTFSMSEMASQRPRRSCLHPMQGILVGSDASSGDSGEEYIPGPLEESTDSDCSLEIPMANNNVNKISTILKRCKSSSKSQVESSRQSQFMSSSQSQSKSSSQSQFMSSSQSQSKSSSQSKSKSSSQSKSKSSSQRQAKSSSQRQAKSSSQRQAKSSSQRQAKSSSQRQAESSSQRQAESSSQSQAESSSQSQAESSSQSQAESSSQSQAESSSQSQAESSNQSQFESSRQRQSKSSSQRQSNSSSQRQSESSNQSQFESSRQRQSKSSRQRQSESSSQSQVESSSQSQSKSSSQSQVESSSQSQVESSSQSQVESSSQSSFETNDDPAESTCMNEERVGQMCADEYDLENHASVFVNPAMKKEDGSRCYDKKHHCFYCKKVVQKMSRHLFRRHNDEIDVSKAFSFPKNSKERRLHLDLIRNKGNFEHNTKVLECQKGKLIPFKQPKKKTEGENFLHCVYCYALFTKRVMWRHFQVCKFKPQDKNSKPGKTRIQALCAFAEPAPPGFSDAYWKFLNEMNQDKVAIAVKKDCYLLEYGYRLFKKNERVISQHQYIRQKLRELGRLMLAAKKVAPVNTIDELIKPDKYCHIVTAARCLAGFNDETGKYKCPSLARKVGHSLLALAMFKKSEGLKARNKGTVQDAEDFAQLYQESWKFDIASQAQIQLDQSKWNSPQLLPFTQDVQNINSQLSEKQQQHLDALKEEASPSNWKDLAKVTLAQVILFNRRREGEVSKMPLSVYLSRDLSETHEDVNLALTELEQKLCKHFVRITIVGKRGRKVPVLLTPLMKESLDALVEKREECGVLTENGFLFALPHSVHHLRGSDCIRQLVHECSGIKNPKALTSTKLRKHIATLSTVLNLKNTELDQLADFLGHNIDVHRKHYRLPEGTLQLAKISKVLLALEQGKLGKYKGKSLDEIHIDPNEVVEIEACSQEDIEDVSMAEGQGSEEVNTTTSVQESPFTQNQNASTPEAQESEDEASTTSLQEGTSTENQRSRFSKKRGKQPVVKRTWTQDECAAVQRHLKKFLTMHQIPGKEECERCLSAEPEVLKNRDWRAVKYFVKNRIASLRRKFE